MCPMYLGVKGVIAKSIERIHAPNLVNFGIVPFTLKMRLTGICCRKTNIRIPGIRRSLEKGLDSVLAMQKAAEKEKKDWEGKEKIKRKKS